MSDTEAHSSGESAAGQPPRHTMPTWEVDLLISGVAVFAVLQLPGWLDGQLFSLIPRLSTDLAEVVLLLYLYLKCVAVILAVTFTLHLLLRAQWIALVGMHTVFPDGVRWDRLHMGPLQRSIEQRCQHSADESIRHADHRATVVFAIGVMLATRLLLLGVGVAVVLALIVAGSTLSGTHANPSILFGLVAAVIILFMRTAAVIDRRFGARLPEDGMPRRILETIFRWRTRSGVGRRSEVMALLASHGDERRINLMTGITIAVLFMAMFFDLSSMKSPVHAGSYGLFPRSVESSRALSSDYYDDQRDPLHDTATPPFIQSAVIEGSYLRLTVPYQPQRDAPALQRSCAGALALPVGDARGDALLDCLARLHAVSLDGRPLSSLRYDVGSDPRTKRPALQAMIDVRSLASGRHLLRVERAPENDGAAKGNSADVIVFWR